MKWQKGIRKNTVKETLHGVEDTWILKLWRENLKEGSISRPRRGIKNTDGGF